MNRNGFILVTTLVMSLMLAGLASVAWAMSELNAQITTNYIRESQVKMAASSGIQHFLALDQIPRHQGNNYIAIPETPLTARLSYIVTIYLLDDQRALVVSRGLYKKASRVLFEHPTRMVISWN